MQIVVSMFYRTFPMVRDAILRQHSKEGTMHNFDISKRDSWLIAKCKQKHLDFSSTFQFVQGHSGKAGSIKVFLEVSKFRI